MKCVVRTASIPSGSCCWRRYGRRGISGPCYQGAQVSSVWKPGLKRRGNAAITRSGSQSWLHRNHLGNPKINGLLGPTCSSSDMMIWRGGLGVQSFVHFSQMTQICSWGNRRYNLLPKSHSSTKMRLVPRAFFSWGWGIRWGVNFASLSSKRNFMTSSPNIHSTSCSVSISKRRQRAPECSLRALADLNRQD